MAQIITPSGQRKDALSELGGALGAVSSVYSISNGIAKNDRDEQDFQDKQDLKKKNEIDAMNRKIKGASVVGATNGSD